MEEDQVREHLNEFDTQEWAWWDAAKNSEEAIQWHCKVIQYLGKLI